MGEQITYGISEAEETSTSLPTLSFFPKESFDYILKLTISNIDKAEIFSYLARFNTLYMISRAGSGHIGGSFSSMDVITWLYLNILKSNDRYFSSKGHDAPGLYSIHTALGILNFDLIHKLRKIDGLPGHPDVKMPGAHTNTGSLGMGVSKAKGFLIADTLNGQNKNGKIFVLTGDGELQEGQFWESLISIKYKTELQNIIVLVDHNKIQSDTYVKNVGDLGNLDQKFKSFDFEVFRIDGHDFSAIEEVFSKIDKISKPIAIICDTIKGKGISFMEHINMQENEEYYKYHSGAPSPEEYNKAKNELIENIKLKFKKINFDIPEHKDIDYTPLFAASNTFRLVPGYSEKIVKIAKNNHSIIALDADLILDTGLIDFKKNYPNRFIECGIAEQDMVSQAGTIALSGLIPIVHSFACFLTSRASEQIYNNCTQGGKVIYVGSLAGVLPGGPGPSHQAVRDIAAMKAMPGIVIIEPLCLSELNFAFDWIINTNKTSAYLRITSIPIKYRHEFEGISKFNPGQGYILREGYDINIIVLGPILTVEVLEACDELVKDNINCNVIAYSFANNIDGIWLKSALKNMNAPILILENHMTEGGFGETISKVILENKITYKNNIEFIGINGVPKSGSNQEVLNAHELSSIHIVEKVKNII
jgi:transketolase